MSEPIAWILQLSVREGRYEDLEALMRGMVESTRAETGTRNYEWFVSDDKATCHLYERYAGNDAALAHIANFGTNFAERFMNLLEPTGFFLYGKPSDEVRGVLDGMGVAYLRPFGGFSR